MRDPGDAATQVDLLIQHGAIVPMDGSRTVYFDGALAINGGMIVAVGPADQIARYKRVFGVGAQTRSFCFVSDLVDGLVRLWASDLDGPVNLGNPVEITILELAREVIDLAGSFWIPPGRLGHRMLSSFLRLYYEANTIKWETLLHPGGDPRLGQPKPPRYVHGLRDLISAWKRLRSRRRT
mgnify:CR=1 FL=1